MRPDPFGFIDGVNLYAYAHHSPGAYTDYWGFASTDIDWGKVAKEAIKSGAKGAALIFGGAALVGAGIVSAPFLATIGIIGLGAKGIMSFLHRANEALDAGKTDFTGSTAIASLGDTIGVTNVIEGVSGCDYVTDRVLGREERSSRLGSGIGDITTLAGSGRIAKMGTLQVTVIFSHSFPSRAVVASQLRSRGK